MPLNMLGYERFSYGIWTQIATFDGEFVISRHAFRWMKNGEVISNGYEMHDMEFICSERDWEIVQAYGDSLAVCRGKQQTGGGEG